MDILNKYWSRAKQQAQSIWASKKTNYVFYTMFALGSMWLIWPYLGVKTLLLVSASGGALELGRRLLPKLRVIALLQASFTIVRYIQNAITEVNQISDYIERAKDSMLASLASIKELFKATTDKLNNAETKLTAADGFYDQALASAANIEASQSRANEGKQANQSKIKGLNAFFQIMGRIYGGIRKITNDVMTSLFGVKSLQEEIQTKHDSINVIAVSTSIVLEKAELEGCRQTQELTGMSDKVNVLNDDIKEVQLVGQEFHECCDTTRFTYEQLEAAMRALGQASNQMETEMREVIDSSAGIIAEAKRQTALNRSAIAKSEKKIEEVRAVETFSAMELYAKNAAIIWQKANPSSPRVSRRSVAPLQPSRM